MNDSLCFQENLKIYPGKQHQMLKLRYRNFISQSVDLLPDIKNQDMITNFVKNNSQAKLVKNVQDSSTGLN